MNRLASVALVVLMFIPAICSAQQAPQLPDFQALMKWVTAKVIHLHIEGQLDAWVPIAPDPYSQANITDRVILDFDWDMQANKMVGQGKYQIVKTMVKSLGSSNPTCKAPVLKGDYEHLDVKEFTLPDGTGEVHLKGTRSFPAADAATKCPLATGLVPVAASQESVEESFPITLPGVMFQGAGASSDTKIAPDNKSYSVKTGGKWVWTYTPTVVN